jgi:hypothetical protein
LALARPLGCENPALAAFGHHTALNVFIIDNSYSAAYSTGRADAKTHLDQAKKLVTEMLSRAQSGGESVVLITASRPATTSMEPQIDLEAARQAVGHIEQSWGATDLRHAFELALDVARRNDKIPDKNLFIITDATRSAWEGADGASLKQLGPELAGEFKSIQHFNLSSSQPQWNGAIADIKPGDNLVSSKFPAEFRADVRGFFPGVDPGHEVSLQWTLDDQPIGKTTASFKLSGATKPQRLANVAFATGGPHVLKATLLDNGDHLPVDNIRRRIVDVASELKVLIVEGKRGIDPEQSSAHYLMPALAGHRDVVPGKPASSDSSFSPEVITDLELGNKVLGDYSAVILAGVGQISSTESDALTKFVQQGGTLLFFMGDAVNKDNYNTMLFKRNRLLPGELVKVMSVGVNEHEYSFDFNPKSVVHPLLKDFANVNSGLDRVPVRSYWQIDIPPDSSAEKVLNYIPTNPKAPADPAITAQTIGQGRVLFVTTTGNLDWTDFPQKPAFLEVVQSMLVGSIRTGDWWMNRVVGEHLSIPSSVRMTTTPVLSDSEGGLIVVSPPEPDAGAVLADAKKADADHGMWRSLYHTEPLVKPGLYTLTLGERKVPIAVNVPAADEADVTTISNDAIRHDLGDITMAMLGPELATAGSSAQDANDFSWWTMVLVLALVGFECFIAMRFGHYRRSEVVTPGAGSPALGAKGAM